MLTGKELGDAIESARIAKGISKKKLAEDFGVAPPSVQGWVKNGRIDKAKLMELIRYFSDVVKPAHWGLSKPIADIITSDGLEIEAKEHSGKVVDLGSRRRSSNKNFIVIPHFDIQASMGPGKNPPSYAEVIRDMTVHLDWLRTQGISYSNLDNLAIITGDDG